jgi:hypothetical protein
MPSRHFVPIEINDLRVWVTAVSENDMKMSAVNLSCFTSTSYHDSFIDPIETDHGQKQS